MQKGDEPVIKVAAPRPNETNAPKMIAIPLSKAAAKAANEPHDPYKFWDEYYKKHDETPGQLLETVAILRQEQKNTDVEACLRGYLTRASQPDTRKDRKNQALPWMYQMLAVAIENRKGTPNEVKEILGFAAFIAARSKNPNDLLSVADTLHRRGIYDKIGPAKISAGEMIDISAKALPHRIEPLLMSILVAQKTKDPIRMADAAEHILALGWPGSDEQMRRDVRTHVDNLAKALKEEGRDKDAETLQAKLVESMTRDIYIRLSWEGVDDIDLQVDEPLGTTAEFKTPRTILGGAIVANGYGKHPQEIYVCPRAFSGTYTIRVDKVYQPDTNPARVANLEIITHEGQAGEKRETRKVDLYKPLPITFTLENGRRKDVLPYLAPPVVDDAKSAAAAPVDAKKAQPAPANVPAARGGAGIKP